MILSLHVQTLLDKMKRRLENIRGEPKKIASNCGLSVSHFILSAPRVVSLSQSRLKIRDRVTDEFNGQEEKRKRIETE